MSDIIYIEDTKLKLLDEECIDYVISNAELSMEGGRVQIRVNQSQYKKVKKLLYAA
jgi:hypothetical protein